MQGQFMKPIKSFLVLAVLCAPALASAQGYYGGPGYGPPNATAPGGFHNRAGRLTWGIALGVGGMHDDGSEITKCANCDFKPLTFEADGHIGGMLSPRFGLMFEAQFNGQTVHSDRFNDDTVLTQAAAMFAAQFW